MSRLRLVHSRARPGASAVYVGEVAHRRRTDVDHRFAYRISMLYLDLGEIERVFSATPLWAHEAPGLGSFHRADYHGDPDRPLADAVRTTVAEQTGAAPSGPIRMLAQPRMLGVCFNPLALYFCFEPDGRTVAAVLADVSNTPWGERHSYVLTPRDQGPGRNGHDQPLRASHPKAFHVSPLLDMDLDYRWTITPPGRRLAVGIEATRAGETVFGASLALTRRPLSPRELNRMLARHGSMPAATLAAIYWQAARLKLKGAPFHPHPGRVAAEAPTEPSRSPEAADGAPAARAAAPSGPDSPATRVPTHAAGSSVRRSHTH